MADGLNIRNTVNGLLFEKPPLGEKGHVKKASFRGLPIKVESRWLDRNSLIKFINTRQEPEQPKIRRGCLGPSNKTLRSLLRNALKEMTIVSEGGGNQPVTVINQKETSFIDGLSPNQLVLYQNLSLPEKNLYEQLYSLGDVNKFPGMFSDVLLSLIKGKVTGFEVNGFDINIGLNKGHGVRKFLGFDLKGNFPERLTLRYDPELKKLSLINCKIPFNYSLFYIMSPESMTLTPEGIFIQADFGKVAKSSGQDKVLEKPLKSTEVFNLFK